MKRLLMLAAASFALSLPAPGWAQAPTNWDPPIIVGSSPPGIDCLLGEWEGVNTFRLEWVRNGTVVRAEDNAGEGSTYALSASDVGATFVCRVTGANDDGPTSAESSAVVIRRPPPPTPPRIRLTVIGQFLDEVIKRGYWLCAGLNESGVVRVRIGVAGRTAARWRATFPDADGGSACRAVRLSRRAKAAVRVAMRAGKALKVTVGASAVDEGGTPAASIRRTGELR